MLNAVFVLGSPDPEMEIIEKILTAAAQRVVYALGPDGRRVHAGNAYGATQVSAPLPRDGVVVLVECGPAETGACYDWYALGVVRYAESEVDTGAIVLRVDHHRPGDPGFGAPPERFLVASSIGQVMRYLDEWGVEAPVPPEVTLVAAADHCLGHAYAGRCPGVDPGELMRWRARYRAAFQRRPVEAVLADIERASGVLRAAPRDAHGIPHLAETVPELPEAACRLGIAYVTAVSEWDGRRKLVLGAAQPDQVSAWLDEQRALGRKTYGDPARGYAGAYLVD